MEVNLLKNSKNTLRGDKSLRVKYGMRNHLELKKSFRNSLISSLKIVITIPTIANRVFESIMDSLDCKSHPSTDFLRKSTKKKPASIKRRVSYNLRSIFFKTLIQVISLDKRIIASNDDDVICVCKFCQKYVTFLQYLQISKKSKSNL